MSHRQVIHIQAQAPVKPLVGTPCNGCGVCCLAEPCPLGSVLSLSRQGPCKALIWESAHRQYRCGALGGVGGAKGWLGGLRNRLVARWIAAGAGCDCALDVAEFSAMADLGSHETELPHD